MIKNKYYKNLYQSISVFGGVMLTVVTLLVAFILILNQGHSDGWILFLMAISLIIMYFIFGFYWIFQKVEFSNNGLKITLLNKTLREVQWDDVDEIVSTNLNTNPALVVKIKGSRNINLDTRKKIKNAFLHFGNEKIQDEIINLKRV